MDFVALLTQLIEILVTGIEGMATGIGGGLNSLVTNIFTVANGDTTTLSMVAGATAIFGGVALCVGLSKKVVGWIMSLGARK